MESEIAAIANARMSCLVENFRLLGVGVPELIACLLGPVGGSMFTTPLRWTQSPPALAYRPGLATQAGHQNEHRFLRHVSTKHLAALAFLGAILVSAIEAKQSLFAVRTIAPVTFFSGLLMLST
jgi:hypothetical protein